ncbi:uncharacterized protein BO96DRAFT_344819 [Aspergillus niger CBS 101883]|uniref:Contig An12c0060, genomic contig n=2 Tax=Aspergillus niger TaxID=5061 RepID=A2QYM4_ASPNC|nr:uncharacterized protein BO96DRAFT_344819 [Aspergillus niger CBS 101883]XP_059605526.1 uncharacterized protein An12g01770 [Aspergillus niger]PYH53682.1 hypothetical protein BO96DRAFT_344819 [Aspergillus niger CBS 101883]CAK48459.1 unnamed protein product [Aspergillus niger]
MKLSSFVISLLLTTVGNASAGCLDHISANTMAIFSGAPLAFATDYQTGSQCASYCGSLAECMSWLYSVRGGECQLYKGTALSTFSSQHFMYGVCDGHRNLTTPSAGSSVAAPASPSTSTVFSAMTSGTPPLHLLEKAPSPAKSSPWSSFLTLRCRQFTSNPGVRGYGLPYVLFN